jgi:hypothetical protein
MVQDGRYPVCLLLSMLDAVTGRSDKDDMYVFCGVLIDVSGVRMKAVMAAGSGHIAPPCIAQQLFWCVLAKGGTIMLCIIAVAAIVLL